MIREGFLVEPLGLYLILERRDGKISRIHLSEERPESTPPQNLKELISKSLIGNEDALIDILDLSSLTKFQKNVLEIVASIPRGRTLTYGQVAQQIGCPGATRAVGRVLSANPFPLIIPCHRVVATKGIGGYSGGVEMKKRLLDLERL